MNNSESSAHKGGEEVTNCCRGVNLVGHHYLSCRRGYSNDVFYSNCLNHDYGHHSETCLTFGKKGAYPTHEAGATYTGPRG